MEMLKIATFNVNNKMNKNGGVKKDGTSNALIVSDMLKSYDLIGTQEFNAKYLKNVMSDLENYKAYGDYRAGNMLKFMPNNESNSIITNQNVISSETIKLPFISKNFKDLKTSIVKKAIIPRIATIIVFKTINDEELCMINTHLDYQVSSVQMRQLNVLRHLIIRYSEKYPLILTGNFNMELSDSHFNNFVLGIKDAVKMVDIDSYTWMSHDCVCKTWDYIFVPKGYKVEDAGFIESFDTSDHRLVYANIRKK